MQAIPLSVEFLGLIAAALTTISYVPQVVKLVKTKQTEGVSLTMFIILFVGIVMWLIYGLYLNSIAMIVANITTLSLTSIIIFYRIKFRKK